MTLVAQPHNYTLRAIHTCQERASAYKTMTKNLKKIPGKGKIRQSPSSASLGSGQGVGVEMLSLHLH